jgi:hypothetical protein
LAQQDHALQPSLALVLLFMSINTKNQDMQEVTIVAEELQEDQMNVSDCASTAGTASTAGSCWGSISSMGSVVSCGSEQLN